MTDVRILERLPTVTLFGTRLFDPLSGEVLAGGFDVTLRQDHGARLGPVQRAFLTGSRVYAFQRLPGLRGFEHADPDTLAQSPLPRVPYILEIRDPEARFLPVALRLFLPLPYRGLFPLGEAEPAGSLGGDRRFQLYSAPSRAIATWQGRVTGELTQADGTPAAHAAIEVDFGNGLIHQGLADARGRFALPFAYPPVPQSAGASPPAPEALADVAWPFSVRVHYDPAQHDRIDGTGLPDHISLLDQFAGPASNVFALAPADGGVPVPFLPGVLRRGQDSIARTAGLSSLVVQPATGSP
ncbi:MAG: hypothetical protein AAGK69_00565 [Pseudomonadota bacterium]